MTEITRRPSESQPLLEPHVQPEDEGTEREARALGLKTYNSLTTLAVALNCIIGTGCFGLPYAFSTSGLGLTALFLVAGGLYALITMNYTLEIMSRCHGVVTARSDLEPPKHCITYQKYGFAAIGDVFGGGWGRAFAQITMSAYGLGSLWSYSSVFASSVSALVFSYVWDTECNIYGEHTSGCELSYYICMAVFALIVITLSLMDVGDQAGIQQVLTCYRIVAFFVMLVTLVVKLGFDSDKVADRVDAIGFANWNKFALGFGATMVAVNCHYNMPDVLQPMQHKESARSVTFCALILSVCLYLVLGLVGAIAFDRPDVNQLASLMWAKFTACGSGWDDCPEVTVYSKCAAVIVQLVVMFFPVVNVVSAFPLITITIGDNMVLSLPSAVQEKYPEQVLKTVCRLSVAIPPLVLATIFKRLDIVFSIAGLFGFLLSLTFPTVFQYVSVQYCLKRWQGAWVCAYTPYTYWPISNRYVAAAGVALSIACTGLSVLTLVNV